MRLQPVSRKIYQKSVPLVRDEILKMILIIIITSNGYELSKVTMFGGNPPLAAEGREKRGVAI